VDAHTYRAGARGAREGRLFARSGVAPDAADSTIEAEFESGPEAASWARSALIALEARIDRRVMEDVRLLVSELVTNSVRHSGAPDGDSVRLAVALDGEVVHVVVSDGGPGFEPRPRGPAQSKAGGWGLFLVERLADRWGVACNGKTRVWFEIDAPAA
jgi:anti-sigma regulatory factor (Ser/Thr protein kinase)